MGLNEADRRSDEDYPPLFSRHSEKTSSLVINDNFPKSRGSSWFFDGGDIKKVWKSVHCVCVECKIWARPHAVCNHPIMGWDIPVHCSPHVLSSLPFPCVFWFFFFVLLLLTSSWLRLLHMSHLYFSTWPALFHLGPIPYPLFFQPPQKLSCFNTNDIKPGNDCLFVIIVFKFNQNCCRRRLRRHFLIYVPISQRERISPNVNTKKDHTGHLFKCKLITSEKNIMCLHMACALSSKCLEVRAFQFVSKRSSYHRVLSKISTVSTGAAFMWALMNMARCSSTWSNPTYSYESSCEHSSCRGGYSGYFA